MRWLGRVLFYISQTRTSGWFVRFAFHTLSGVLPVRRVRSKGRTIAFYHPHPHWDRHIVVVPKRSVASVVESHQSVVAAVGETFHAALDLGFDLGMERPGFSVLVNGGRYQVVQQLHFHLATTDSSLRYRPDCGDQASSIVTMRELFACHHRFPSRRTHVVINPLVQKTWKEVRNANTPTLGEDLIQICQLLVTTLDLDLVNDGFTVIANVLSDPTADESSLVSFQFVAGPRLVVADPQG